MKASYSDHGKEDIETMDKGVQIVKELLENKSNPKRASINGKDEYELTPLHHAALRYIHRYIGMSRV